MAASNFVGFSWTEEKSSIFLEIMTHLVISKKLDPLADRYDRDDVVQIS